MAGGVLDFFDLGFGETNQIKENDSNPSADRRRTATTTTIRLSSERAFAKDTLENRNTFNGYVINARMVTVPLMEDPTKLAQLKSKVSYEIENDNAAAAASWLYKVYIPELSPLQPPKSATDPVIQLYPDITLWSGATIGSQDLPYGTQVVVRFADLGNMTGGTIEAIAHKGNPTAQADPCGQGLQAIYNNGTPAPVSGQDGKHNNLTYTLKRGLPVGTSSQRVVGSDLPKKDGKSLEDVVNVEIAFWRGKNENSGPAWNDRIQLYQDYVFMEYHNKPRQAIKGSDGVYYHWSAIYISWIMSRITPFPAYSYHTGYAGGAKREKHGWTLWITNDLGSGEVEDTVTGLKGNYKIQANVGDVLIYPPKGRWGKKTNSHGDAVYKIEDGKAWLTGGNLEFPGTALANFTLPLDAAGNYSGFASTRKPRNPYQIILKKGGRLE